MLLKGKTAVITGCLRGIGRTTMDRFAENGADIFACSFEDTEEFQQHISHLQSNYMVTITPLFFDLRNESQIKDAMKIIVASKTKIDILVNIAGLTHNALFTMTTMQTFRDIFEVDFISQMLITQYIAKLMMKYKSGSIINISSITGIDGNSGQSAYSAAKAALIGATKTLAIEFATAGIRVNAVAPGVIETDMTKSLTQPQWDALLSKCSIPRAGLPSEVADVLMYLASDLSSYVTGQIIRVDGGMG